MQSGALTAVREASSSVTEARAILSCYLAEIGSLERETSELAAANLPDPPLIRIAARTVPTALQTAIRIRLTDLLVVRERRRVRALAQRCPLWLHLGSGKWMKDGWVNVDLVGRPVDLAWNLLRPLPFRDNSTDAIFHEHVVEHFTLQQGFSLLQECFRLLKPGGVLRIGVPDAAAYARSYLHEGRDLIASLRPGRPTPLLAMQEVYYRHGHCTMYDFETLALVCNAAGFTAVERKDSGDSALTPCPDSPHRRLETLYIEAYKGRS